MTEQGGITSVAAGSNHSVALDNNGKVWTAGRNNRGQLGISAILPYSTLFSDAPAGEAPIKSIAAGYDSVLVVNSLGEVWALGDNTYGQLGLGDAVDRFYFDKAPYAENIKSAAIGYKSGYILNADGNLFASGYNGVGELGIGFFPSQNEDRYSQFLLAIKDLHWGGGVNIPVEELVPLAHIKAIFASYDYALALDTSGDLWVAPGMGGTLLSVDIEALNNYVTACGYIWKAVIGYVPSFCDNKGAFSKVQNISNIKSVAAGDYTILALKEDGSLWAAGQNQYGQLGLGDNDFRYSFEMVGLPRLSNCQDGYYYDEESEECKALSTVIYFVNGVWNTEDGAQEGKKALESVYGQYLADRYSLEKFEFKLSYNYHQSEWEDLKEVFWQKMKEAQYDDDFIYNQFVSLLRGAVNPIDKILLIIRDCINVFAIDADTEAFEQNNLNEMISDYLNDIAEDKRLILIAHSQGNLYANQSVRILREQTPNWAQYIKMIGVASPSAVTNDPYITACDDYIIGKLRDHSHSNVLDCNIDNKPNGVDFRDWANHELIRSYLDKRLLSKGLIDYEFYDVLDRWEHSPNQR
jgi:hypothetical protein